MKIVNGGTRTVVLTNKYAIKFPGVWKQRYSNKWRSFLNGLLGNIQEREIHSMAAFLCPVLFSIPGGFLVVMPKGESLTDEEWESFDYYGFTTSPIGNNYGPLPVEEKQCSFKKFNGKILAVDYGDRSFKS